MFIYKSILALSLLIFSNVSFAQLNVLACEAEWAALANSIGGKQLNIYSATTHMQDPHHIQARPSLLAKARTADLLVCSGAELEVGWLPVLLRKSGNPKIQESQLGHFMATDYVELIEKPLKLDRSHGDVHAAGNPHIHADPNLILQVAKELAARLSVIDAQNAVSYKQNLQIFTDKVKSSLQSWQPIIKQLQGNQVIVHHNNWSYLINWLGMAQQASLEPIQGVPPTTRHLQSLLKLTEQNKIDYIMVASYQSQKASEWLADKTGIVRVSLPYAPVNWQEKDAFIKWYEQLLQAFN